MLYIINNLNIKLLLVTLLIMNISLYGGTYDDSYSVINQTKKSVNDNRFMDSSFKEIIRFNPVNFDGDKIDKSSLKILKSVVDAVGTYTKDGEGLHLTIIGHASVKSNKDVNTSNRLAFIVQKYLFDRNISQDITTVEYRNDKDQAYSNATKKGMTLSNRVMLTLYVNIPDDIDTDKDGVIDSLDRCPNTPIGVKVDKHGCPIDSDKDGVANYIDECPNTPLGYRVDKKGCPIDSDRDGVANYKDLCPQTLYGLRVDKNGCPISQVLELNFKFDSFEITKGSCPLIDKFAKFMKENPLYKAQVIGHTDSIGRASYNMTLSQERAKAIMNALLKKGIDASRLSAVGRGELEPIQDNHLRVGRKANRRIEIKLSF